jgi:gas vesicle protein
VTKAAKKGKPKGANRSTRKGSIPHSGDGVKPTDAIHAEAAEIDKVRDILFGSQMAGVEKRFVQLEERLNSQIEALGEQTKEHFKKIEALIQKQDEVLTGRLDSEQSERNQGAETLHQEINDAKEVISKAIDAQAKQQTRDMKAVNQQLKDLSSDLSDEIHIQQVEAAKNLETAVHQLDEDKLARKALSQLLVEMADRLSEPPG